jgi:hypothetical protein
VLVTDGVERRDDVGGIFAGLLQHGVDHILGEIAVKSVFERARKARRMLEREGDIGNRRAVGHICSLDG